MCHPHSCSNACEMKGQLLLRYEYRQCSNPYPLNGGKSCEVEPKASEH